MPSLHHDDLIRFLTDSAQEAATANRHSEAEELLSLRARLLARQFAVSQLQLPLEAKKAA
jgi:hypothetical protein